MRTGATASSEASASERVLSHAGPSSAVSDAELVLRALDGSAWAEAALCRNHARPLIGVLTRLLGSAADADDVAQDAFVVALRTLDRLRDASAFRPWLFRIATNLAKKRLRRRKLERLLGLAPAAEDASLDALASTDVAPEQRAELGLVARRLAKLPADLRLAWTLRFVEGYELTEVAAMCDCSLATIKRRLERASAELHVEVALEGKKP
ncbi:RNA polymerase sigma factor [Myxococcota bacterium]|nr:RNA polymerase sigma factor [Myxococcota bacterium]